MNKRLKNIFTFCLSVLMLATLAVPCLAAEPNTENSLNVSITSETKQVLEGNDAISALMSKGGLSREKAVREYAGMVLRLERLEERYITYNAGKGYLIEVGCLVKVNCGGGHCGYVEVINKWSQASGDGRYEWTPFYVEATIFEDPAARTDNIRFQSRGNLEVTVDGSASAGFEAVGFTLTGSLGGTMHYRKAISINQTWI